MDIPIKICILSIIYLVVGVIGGAFINKLIGEYKEAEFVKKNKVLQLFDIAFHVSLISLYSVYIRQFFLGAFGLPDIYNTTIIFHAGILTLNLPFTKKVKAFIGLDGKLHSN